ncbi:hypothetical protein EYV94_10260 [Puteibacter caeruleilacunae]|nr:hypothetical protein EYV94_10260 [Puteibacter caeruleilacunae]
MRQNINNRALSVLLLLLSSFLVMVGCNDEYDEHYQENETVTTDFINVLKSEGCSQFADKLASYNYDVLLKESRLFTVMAPKDAAFAALIEGMTEQEVKAAVLYHIYNGVHAEAKLVDDEELFSVSGKRVVYNTNKIFEGYNGTFGGIQKANIKVKNGMVHVLENAFQPVLSMGEQFEQRYSRFAEVFDYFATEVEDVSQSTAQIADDGHSVSVTKGLIDYTYINPYNEAIAYTLLPFSNEVWENTFGQLKAILTGYEEQDEEMTKLYDQFIVNHMFPGIIDGQTMAEGLNKNFQGIPVSLPEGRIVNADQSASNGMLHELDTILIAGANIQARIDHFYKSTDFTPGDEDDITLATSSRSNNTKLAKEEGYAVWSKDTTMTKEGGYLFFNLPRELAAAKYVMTIEHQVDSGYTDIVKVTVNDMVVNEALSYDDSTSVVAGTKVDLIQEVGVVDFSTYQKSAKVRLDIVEERNLSETEKDVQILNIKKITFEPYIEPEEEL